MDTRVAYNPVLPAVPLSHFLSVDQAFSRAEVERTPELYSPSLSIVRIVYTREFSFQAAHERDCKQNLRIKNRKIFSKSKKRVIEKERKVGDSDINVKLGQAFLGFTVARQNKHSKCISYRCSLFIYPDRRNIRCISCSPLHSFSLSQAAGISTKNPLDRRIFFSFPKK